MSGQSRFEAWSQAVSNLLLAYRDLSEVTSKHGTTKGDARELFVAHVLGRLLPSNLHIGSGQVIGREGQHSRQIDVLVYRPDLPRLSSLAATGLYFAEGVVASIEVKSNLNCKRLRKACINCSSVKQRYHHGRALGGSRLSGDVPATYIYAYSGYKSRLEKLQEAVRSWMNREKVKEIFQLPDVIATEGLVAIKNDGTAIHGDLVNERFESPPVFLARRDENPLMWLLLHLLQKLKRSGLADGSLDYLMNQSLATCKSLVEEAKGWGECDSDSGEIIALP